MKEITVNELFSGIGSQRKAFERCGISHSITGISEIDKFAVKSYEAIFGKTKNYGDISKVESLDCADMWTYSFPCTDISVSGKMKGLVGTRSGLLYEVERLLDISKEKNELPKYLMLENVKNLVGKKFKPDFDKWLEYLESLGYNNYWDILNGRDFNIPQNRERVFVISIRKDIDDKTFKFPESIKLTLKLEDILEKSIGEKYYISKELEEKFKTQIINKTNSSNWNDVIKLYNFPIIGASRGRYNEEGKTEQQLELNKIGCCNTLTSVQKDNLLVEAETYRIRRLTPKEQWRLMGFNDEDFKKAEKVCSNTNLYKQSSNSIIINVLEEIFKNLFKENR